jgi:hypothetical protein
MFGLGNLAKDVHSLSSWSIDCKCDSLRLRRNWEMAETAKGFCNCINIMLNAALCLDYWTTQVSVEISEIPNHGNLTARYVLKMLVPPTVCSVLALG